MRRIGLALASCLVLLLLGAACFVRLLASPCCLIADAERPSVDYANHGDDRGLGNDATFVFLPRHLYVAKVLSEFGHLPAWDSAGFGGRPIIGNPQSGIFYPPVWICWVFPHPAVLGWLTFGHLLGAGLGVYVLARSQYLERWPAVVAAGVFQAAPYLLAQTFEGHYPHVWSACWYPWAFWACARSRAGDVRGLLALPLVLAMTYLTGHPQEWLQLLTALTVWVLVDAVSLYRKGREGKAAAVRSVLAWTGIVALGLGLVAVDLEPARRLLPWTQSPSLAQAGSSQPRNYQLHYLNGLQLLSVEALGGPADYLGVDNFWESVLAYGLIALVLSVVAMISSPRRRPVRGWTLLAVLSIWFAAGRQSAIYHVLCSVLPALAWFRVPARSLFLASLAVAMLSGFGVETLRSALVERAPWRGFAARLLRAGGAVLVLLATGRQLALFCLVGTASLNLSEVQSARKGREWDEPAALVAARYAPDVWRACQATDRLLHDRVFWITGLALSGAVGAGCLAATRTGRSRMADLIGLLALCELAWHGQALLKVAPADLFFQPDPVSESLILNSGHEAFAGPLRVRARDAFFLDLQAVRYGIEKTNVNDVFQIQAAAYLYKTLYPVAVRTATLRRAHVVGRGRPSPADPPGSIRPHGGCGTGVRSR